MDKNKIKFDHFNNIKELIQHLEMWYSEDDYFAYDRWFHLDDARKMGIYVYEQYKEIERLNNIIDELVKFMDEDYEYYEKYGHAEQGHAMGQIRRIKNKLQELKGVDK